MRKNTLQLKPGPAGNLPGQRKQIIPDRQSAALQTAVDFNAYFQRFRHAAENRIQQFDLSDIVKSDNNLSVLMKPEQAFDL